MAEYYVLLGDVVHSRSIEDREAFQAELEDICGRFTAERRDDVYGNFKILKGVDEFGGVLQSIENLYEVVTAFHDGLAPHEVRIAVASGDIDVGLTSFDVERMDGDAFHRATGRVEELEDESMVFDLLLAAEAGPDGAEAGPDGAEAGPDGAEAGPDGAGPPRAGDADLGRAVADEMNLLVALRSEWTDRQREVIAVRESVETQIAAAEELGVTQQSVSNVLAGAKWPLVHAVEERLRETLGSYSRGREKVRVGRTKAGGTLGEWLSTLDWDDVADDVPAPVRAAVEAGLPDDVLEAPDGVDAFLDHLREVAGWDSEADSLHLEVARFLRDHGRPSEALDEYEAVLDRNPDDVAVYVEYAELAVEEDRHQRALARLVGLLEAAADAGTVEELVDAVPGRFGVVESVLASDGDERRVRRALGLLVHFARRTSDPVGEDVRRWALVQHARLLDESHALATLSDDVSAGRCVVDSYCTGLGFLLAAEPEMAVGYFERAWEVGEEATLDEPDRRLADAGGVALLGCERVLGPAILDVTPDDLRAEIAAAETTLRAPVTWVLARLTGDEPTDGGAPVEPDTPYEAFAELEARAFETLYDLVEQWADAE